MVCAAKPKREKVVEATIDMAENVSNDLSLSKEAIELFQQAVAACNTTRQRMLSASMVVRDDLCKKHGLPWEQVTRASRRKWLLKMLEGPIYAACKVGKFAGVPETTYNSLKTTIVYALVYQHKGKLFPLKHCRMTGGCAAIEAVFEKAVRISGSISFEQKVEMAIAACKKDPEWAGNKEKGTRSRRVDTSSLPTLADVDSAPAWLCEYLSVIADWANAPCLGGSMTHLTFLAGARDPRFKKMAEIVKSSQDLRLQFALEDQLATGE